jgi:hypothetical protein
MVVVAERVIEIAEGRHHRYELVGEEREARLVLDEVAEEGAPGRPEHP